MVIYKQFDKELFAANDQIGKDKATEIIHKIPDLIAIANPKVRGVDLLIYRKNVHICNIEVERKLKWVTTEFPYENINFPLRKKKYAELAPPTIFMMFSETWNDYLVVAGSELLAAPQQEIHNKFVRCGEYFFVVPKDKVIFNDLEQLIKQMGV